MKITIIPPEKPKTQINITLTLEEAKALVFLIGSNVSIPQFFEENESKLWKTYEDGFFSMSNSTEDFYEIIKKVEKDG